MGAFRACVGATADRWPCQRKEKREEEEEEEEKGSGDNLLCLLHDGLAISIEECDLIKQPQEQGTKGGKR